MKRFLPFLFASAVLLLFAGPSMAVSIRDAPRMTKEQLKPLLGSPNVIVLDERSVSDYNSSREKIKGAIRVQPGNAKPIIDTYPKDKTIVLY